MRTRSYHKWCCEWNLLAVYHGDLLTTLTFCNLQRKHYNLYLYGQTIFYSTFRSAPLIICMSGLNSLFFRSSETSKFWQSAIVWVEMDICLSWLSPNKYSIANVQYSCIQVNVSVNVPVIVQFSETEPRVGNYLPQFWPKFRFLTRSMI